MDFDMNMKKSTAALTDTIEDQCQEEYPRPNLERPEWKCLNGLWDYCIRDERSDWDGGYIENNTDDILNETQYPEQVSWEGKIQVPFCVESRLSGVERFVRPNQTLWYRRFFIIPPEWSERRILLNFEAVDWHAVVWINGVPVGHHKGGYCPFSFDISNVLREGIQEVIVGVWDPSDYGDQAVGKQTLPEHAEGYRYTPITGIWQTVWLEPVNEVYIKDINVISDIDKSAVAVEIQLNDSKESCTIYAEVYDKQVCIATGQSNSAEQLMLYLADYQPWSPDNPALYTLKIQLQYDNQLLDEITTFFGMRKIHLEKDQNGVPGVYLNHQPIFQFGPLDQGYWPDGILTPPSEESILYDLHYLKQISCNMVRVHIKVHPRRWYYHCDRLGILVWQDMVCTRKFNSSVTEHSSIQWENEQKEMMACLKNHPCIVTWVVFNEAWGQYDTERITDWVMKEDTSRLVNSASGWFDHGIGHFYDIHDYSFYPAVPLPGQIENRAVVLGESGGFDMREEGHGWREGDQQEEFSNEIVELVREGYANKNRLEKRYSYWITCIAQLIKLGCSAVVYTQLSDVEHELNGWLTYDREVSKIEPSILRALHENLFQKFKEPKAKPLKEFAKRNIRWHYQFSEGEESRKKTGCGPFGGGNILTEVKTDWPVAEELRLEKEFQYSPAITGLSIRIAGIGNIACYLNGKLVKDLKDHSSTEFFTAPLPFIADIPLEKKQLSYLVTGTNMLTVVCSPICDSRYIDIQLVCIAASL